MLEPGSSQLLASDLIQLAFAVKASIWPVCYIAGSVDLVRVDELVPGSKGLSEAPGCFSFARRQAGADSGDAQGLGL
jgi:hypothetical protein